mmetsp:Transcript_68320/g.211375  ORF Transcript_68320/g.211375 Transcript_68320/m.211375 type:complete len:267 (+) Transcript_68320:136-936(+)
MSLPMYAAVASQPTRARNTIASTNAWKPKSSMRPGPPIGALRCVDRRHRLDSSGIRSARPSSVQCRREARARCTIACLRTRGLATPPHSRLAYHTKMTARRTPTMMYTALHAPPLLDLQAPPARVYPDLHASQKSLPGEHLPQPTTVQSLHSMVSKSATVCRGSSFPHSLDFTQRQWQERCGSSERRGHSSGQRSLSGAKAEAPHGRAVVFACDHTCWPADAWWPLTRPFALIFPGKAPASVRARPTAMDSKELPRPWDPASAAHC